MKSVCVLAALIAIGVSAWMSLPLLSDAVFIQMWGVPLSSQRSAINAAVAALTGYEQLALVVVAAVGVAAWVASWAALGALWTRYPRRLNIAESVLVLYGLAWRTVAERLLTVGQASGVVFLSMAFAAAWLTVLRAVGVSVADMPAANAVWVLSPVLLVLTVGVLAPWSYNRIRHT